MSSTRTQTPTSRGLGYTIYLSAFFALNSFKKRASNARGHMADVRLSEEAAELINIIDALPVPP